MGSMQRLHSFDDIPVYNVRRKIANAQGGENVTLSKFVPQQAAAPSGACVDGLAYSPILSPA